MHFDQWIGSETVFSVRHRLLNSILLLGCLLSFWGSLANAFFRLGSAAIWTYCLIGLCLAGLFYLSRVRHYYNLPINLAMALILIAVPAAWIQTGGCYGRVPLLTSLFVPMMAVLLQGIRRLSAVATIIILLLGMIGLEYFRPELIHYSGSAADRYLEMAFALTLNILAGAFIFGKIFGYYQQENNRCAAYLAENLQTQKSLSFLSYNDKLTGAHNTVFFEEELLRLEDEDDQPIGVFYFDLDGLKFINNALGHESGNLLLQRTANILRRTFPQNCSIFRIGGDEFVILLPIVQSTAMEHLYKKVQTLLALENQQIAPDDIQLNLSFGYALGNSRDIRALLNEAEGKMYREKLFHQTATNRTILHTVRQILLARDSETESHGTRLEELIESFARQIDMPPSAMADIKVFAKFHDIGKVGIPDHILLKPGKLTPEERLEMQKHSEIGYRIAQTSLDLLPIANLILKHHEWWNGRGYPLGLSGAEIPVECRLLAIVDSYDAMTTDRPYRKRMDDAAARQELVKCAGSQFDPVLIHQFMTMLQERDKRIQKSSFS